MSATALVLAAHGAGTDSDANRLVEGIASRVRDLGTFHEVAAAFHRGTPSFCGVLDRLQARDVIVVPFMTSAGYYATTVLPRELARHPRHDDLRVRYSAPLGVHPGLPDLVAGRIASWSAAGGIRVGDLAAVFAGHGTARHPDSRRAAEALATKVLDSGVTAEAHCVFIDESPPIEAALGLTRRPVLMIIPFLIGGGPHALSDLPGRLGLRASGRLPVEGRVDGRRVFCDRSVGTYPELAALIHELAQSMLPAGDPAGPHGTAEPEPAGGA